MKRRSLLFTLVGVGVGWVGATEFGGQIERPIDQSSQNSTANVQAPVGPDTGGSTPNGTGATTAVASAVSTSGESGSSNEPDSMETPSPATRTAESTTERTSTATATATRDLRKKISVYSQGHGDPSGGSYSVLYVVRNEWNFDVRVTFEAAVSLRDGSHRRKQRTATIDPGSVANDSFEFSDLTTKAAGWSFQLVSITRP